MQIKAKLINNAIFHFALFTIIFVFSSCYAQKEGKIIFELGNERITEYLPLLKGKRVGMVVNQSSLVGKAHLVDTLLALGIEVETIFSPEHGFRGEAADGITVEDGLDTQTGVPVISLYGKVKKPTKNHLADIDIVLFDIQDVGTRFYTYLSTMHWVMEACAENNIPFVVLDKPNPNSHFIDGPVLEAEHRSIVGMHEIPVVHAMTLGELALMINQEGWLSNSLKCDLKIIDMKGWSHGDFYHLPVRPSPNLPDDEAISWYPSLCFFEGTVVSVGRGTDHPFTRLGHPELEKTSFSFTPISRKESVYPKLENQTCYGVDLFSVKPNSQIDLSYLIKYYKELNTIENPYFKKYFTRLAGTETLQKQIENGVSENDIRHSWKNDLEKFKKLRSKYLLYQDFK